MKNNIYLTCKLFDWDAFYFTAPLTEINTIEKVIVFRNTTGIKANKIEYVTPLKKYFGQLNFIFRIFQMVWRGRKNVRLIIGIYEIPHGLIAMLAGKILRRPTVVCIIGNPAYTPLRKGIRKKITYWILRNVNYITTTGTNSKSFLVSEGFDKNKIFILPNSIDVHHFVFLNTEKKYDLITLGRISPEKQIPIFIETIEKIKQSIPNIKAAIAGKGPDFEKIKMMIVEKKLQDNIDMLGYLPDEQLVSFFNSGKIFISCSETEGFPRTVIQSIACGTPCIASEVGDMVDLIIEQHTGFLISDSRDVNAYSEKIVFLLQNSDKYIKMRENGIDLVHLKYSHKAATTMWQQLIKKKQRQ
jgi:glycosyltransferase involved in cell wall biosynthesis